MSAETKHTVEPENQADHELGLEIIRVLGLKRKRDNGRVETSHGDKNPCGLTRTLRSLSASPLEQSAPEMLDALKAIQKAYAHLTPFEHGEEAERALDAVDAAIAKAEGGEA